MTWKRDEFWVAGKMWTMTQQVGMMTTVAKGDIDDKKFTYHRQTVCQLCYVYLSRLTIHHTL